MQGFCESGILILPEINTVNGEDKQYASLLFKGLENVVKYFANIGIQLECPSIMEFAPSVQIDGIQWINTLTPEDTFFAEEAFKRKRRPNEKDIDDFYYVKARTKFPAQKGLSGDDRVELIDKREKFITNSYIEDKELVLLFENPRLSRYKVKSKEDDGRIVITVNPNTFVMSAKMSSEDVLIEELLEGYKWAKMPVSDWRL